MAETVRLGSGHTYGSYSAPTNIGSGANNWGSGGSGGGAVILNVANTLTVNGGILANGIGPAFWTSGSGGSVYITASVLTGTGTISANATNGANSSGGGGRVAVIASTATFTGTFQAYGGATSSQQGAAGTVFIKTPGNNGTLIIDNNNTPTSFLYTGLTPADYTSTPMDHLWLNHAGKLWMNYPSTFTITSGGNVAADGTGNELRMDGVLHTPAALSISSYTMTISSFSYMPDMTSLDIGYGSDL